jgi:uncharacterized protein CbrC (UPF0167 family)
MYLRQIAIDEIIVSRYTTQKETTMDFRTWCREKWFEHCEEIEAWTGNSPRYLSAEYFSKYKWWLRREYRAQK